MKHDQAKALIEARFKNETLPELQSKALDIHLRSCEACRAFYDRTVVLESGLEGGDFPPKALYDRLLAKGPPPPKRAPRRWPVVVSSVLAMAAAIILFAVVPGPDDTSGEFRRRGIDRPASQTAWITIYRHDGQKSTPLKTKLSPKDGLLFAYTNSGPHKYLMIAGKDAAGRAHWYHPAYEHEDQDPKSIDVKTGVAERPLAERVYIKHQPGTLLICAIFSERPLRVKAVDAALERTGQWPEDALLDCHKVQVEKANP